MFNRLKLMKEMEEIIERDSDIKAIFYGGSIGSDMTDEFSDIDIRLIIPDSIKVRDKLEDIVQQLNAILFIEEAGNNYAVVHFSSFVKTDIFIYHMSDLAPNTWLKEIVIVKDTDDKLIGKLQKDSFNLKDEITINQVNSSINKFLAHSSESYRRLQRKEWHYFQHCTLSMKNCLVSLWLMQDNYRTNSLGDWSKYEGFRSKLSSEKLTWLQKNLQIDAKNYVAFLQAAFFELIQTVEIIEQKNNFSIEKEKIIKTKGILDDLLDI